MNITIAKQFADEAKKALRADNKADRAFCGSLLHAIEFVYFKAIRCGLWPIKPVPERMKDLKDIMKEAN